MKCIVACFIRLSKVLSLSRFASVEIPGFEQPSGGGGTRRKGGKKPQSTGLDVGLSFFFHVWVQGFN